MTTKTKTINGLQFEISQPYVKGSVLTEAEAKALNQTRSENIGNNVRAKLKEAVEAGKSVEELAAIVAAVDAEYVFTLASVSASAKRDPYEAEAFKMAKALIKEHLAAKGRKITDIPEGSTKEEWEAKLEGEYERVAASAGVVAAAKKAVDARRKTASSLLETLGDVEV